MRRLASSALAAALFFTSHPPALADPTPRIPPRRDLGAQAQAASEAGNFAESSGLGAARQPYPAAPTSTPRLPCAQVKPGKYVIARENYNKIIREQSGERTRRPRSRRCSRRSKAEIEAATAKIAHVTITIEEAPPTRRS